MLILAVDSTAKTAAAALVRDGESVGSVTLDAGNMHSETLLPAVEFLLSSACLNIDNIDVFACATGPGSFTGVRIGTAAVKGLAFGRGSVCAAVDVLDAIAENLADTDCIACPVMDARRGQVYTAVYECRGVDVKKLTDDMAISADELGGVIAAINTELPVMFAGDGYDIVYPKLSARLPNVRETPRILRGHSAVSVARAAMRDIECGKDLVDAETLSPIYLRPSQAEREYAEKHTETKND